MLMQRHLTNTLVPFASMCVWCNFDY